MEGDYYISAQRLRLEIPFLRNGILDVLDNALHKEYSRLMQYNYSQSYIAEQISNSIIRIETEYIINYQLTEDEANRSLERNYIVTKDRLIRLLSQSEIEGYNIQIFDVDVQIIEHILVLTVDLQITTHF